MNGAFHIFSGDFESAPGSSGIVGWVWSKSKGLMGVDLGEP